jgi:hypothetical protein
MTKLNKFFVGAGMVAALGLVGCGSKSDSTGYTPKPTKAAQLEEIDPNSGKELWPMKVGNSWTYDVESTRTGQAAAKTDEVTFTVASVNGDKSVIDVSINGEKKSQQCWQISDKGIFQVWTGKPENVFNPPQPLVLFPLEAKKSFDWKGSGPTILGVSGTQSATTEMLGTQLVDTSIGSKSAFSVVSNGTFKATLQGKPVDGRVQSAAFLAPGIGLVRYRQETAFMTPTGPMQTLEVIRLKVHSLK